MDRDLYQTGCAGGGRYTSAVPAAHAFQLRKCVRPRPTSRLTMWRRATSIDWWRCWQTSRSGATRVWLLQLMIFGKCGGHGNEARAGRTLWFWLGSIEAGLENLYSPCAACGFPTVLLCHVCHRFVCFDCTRPCRVGWPLLCWVPASLCHKDGLGSGPQALGGEGPQAVSVQVAEWRAAHGVRLDEDFAFAFCSLKEA